MSSANSSTAETGRQYSCKGRGCCSKGNWSGLNIAAMVIGFVVFWPLGLLILYWNITGRNIQDLPGFIQEKWSALVRGTKNQDGLKGENTVFDEFQQTQYDRVKELKEEIKNRARNFKVFKGDAKRREDEAEFKDFMSSDHSQGEK